MYSADALTQARRAVGVPRQVPLSGIASLLIQVARQIEPSGLDTRALGEAGRILGGVANAFNYEKLRAAGWRLVEGWDKGAPHASGLPVVREYQIRHPSNAKAYVSEPTTVTAGDMRALVDLASSGHWEV